MNKNIVQNKKTTTPKGICLNDKDYMNSILSSLKEMSKNYTVALTEASNETLFKSLKKDTCTSLNDVECFLNNFSNFIKFHISFAIMEKALIDT